MVTGESYTDGTATTATQLDLPFEKGSWPPTKPTSGERSCDFRAKAQKFCGEDLDEARSLIIRVELLMSHVKRCDKEIQDDTKISLRRGTEPERRQDRLRAGASFFLLVLLLSAPV